MMVSNCPRCQIVRGVKLSSLHGRCQIVLFCMMVSNCPRCQIVLGVKLSSLHGRCQIVLGVKLSSVSNCPITLSLDVFARSSLLLLLFLSSWILWNSQRMSCASSPQVQILVDAISLLKCGEIFYLLFAPLSMSAVFTCAARLSRLSPN